MGLPPAIFLFPKKERTLLSNSRINTSAERKRRRLMAMSQKIEEKEDPDEDIILLTPPASLPHRLPKS